MNPIKRAGGLWSQELLSNLHLDCQRHSKAKPKQRKSNPEFSAQPGFEQWPSLQTNPHLIFTAVFNCPPQKRTDPSLIYGSFVLQEAVFFCVYGTKALFKWHHFTSKGCIFLFFSRLTIQLRQAEEFPDRLGNRIGPGDQWSMWLKAAVRSGPERLFGDFSVILLQPVDRWEGWRAKCNISAEVSGFIYICLQFTASWRLFQLLHQMWIISVLSRRSETASASQ